MFLKFSVILLCLIFFFLVLIPGIFFITGINLFGGEGGGAEGYVIVRSSDGGNTWQKVTSSAVSAVPFSSQILAFAFHPADNKVLYFGARGSGLWKTVNNGQSWKRVIDAAGTLKVNADVYKIEVSSSNPAIMYVAVVQNDRGRVLKSTDGGARFEEIYAVSAVRYGVFDLFVDAASADRVMIATGEGGLLQTDNGGKTWRVIKWFDEPLEKLLTHDTLLTHAFVTTSRGNVFKTIDGGTTWSDMSGSLQGLRVSPLSGAVFDSYFSSAKKTFGEFTFDPIIFSRMYFTASTGLFRSDDGGISWSQIRLPLAPSMSSVDAVSVSAQNVNLLFVGAGRTLLVSGDSGISWKSSVLSPTMRIKSIFAHPRDSRTVFAILGR